MAQDALLVVLSAVFFYFHAAAVADGKFTSIPFAAEQGLLVGMFLVRRKSRATSTRLIDWVVATGGWLPLAARPNDGSPDLAQAVGVAFQMVGLSATCIGFLYLGRSFGVVAANRGLKVNGPYRLVRHPIYLSHATTSFGFLLANLGYYNAGLLLIVAVCQIMRIQAEERVLTDTADYSAYKARVRWRLIPGLY
jgi:protein-S-isoprenylcysteine O-methyltransferase Ste14